MGGREGVVNQLEQYWQQFVTVLCNLRLGRERGGVCVCVCVCVCV